MGSVNGASGTSNLEVSEIEGLWNPIEKLFKKRGFVTRSLKCLVVLQLPVDEIFECLAFANHRCFITLDEYLGGKGA